MPTRHFRINRRWASRDPLAERGGLNLYAYVGNQPLSRIDPDGRMAGYIFAGVAVGAIIILYGVRPQISVSFNPGPHGEGQATFGPVALFGPDFRDAMSPGEQDSARYHESIHQRQWPWRNQSDKELEACLMELQRLKDLIASPSTDCERRKEYEQRLSWVRSIITHPDYLTHPEDYVPKQ